MTAIYLLWNNNGLALAADSNQTGRIKNQAWVDPVEKIVQFEAHQIVIGASGNASYQGVEVNELFRSWEASIPLSGKDSVTEYVSNFLAWLAVQKLPSRILPYEEIREFYLTQFDYFKNELIDLAELNTPKALEEFYFLQYKLPRSKLNIFSPEWEAFDNWKDVREKLSDSSYQLAEEIKVIRDNINQIFQTIEPTRNIIERAQNHEDWGKVWESSIHPAFQEVFGRSYEPENDLDATVIELVTSRFESMMPDYSPISVLFCGYGQKEWLPSGIQIELAPSFLGVPRAGIVNCGNPNNTWYMAIGVESAVDQLVRGHSPEHRTEIIESIVHLVDSSKEAEIQNSLQLLASKKFSASMERMDYLTLERLEYVARLFVQVEALKSYLDEPIPGVGGDTTVVTMTKTMKRIKKYKELSQ